MEKQGNAINWFEIPVVDFERAKKFYSEMFAKEVVDHEMPDPSVKYAILPYEPQSGVGGALMHSAGAKPSMDGIVVYLNGGDDLSDPLSRVEAAGGKILVPKTSIGENGFMAHVIDTEGNRVALHSMN